MAQPPIEVDQIIPAPSFEGSNITNVDAITISGASLGSGPNNIPQLDGTGKLPAVDGSNLTSMTKSQVGLGNVDNTSDANKPISNATQTALNGKLNKSGGTMTGQLTMNANISMSGNRRIINLQNPSSAQDAATRSYVDNRTPVTQQFTSGERAIPGAGSIETWNHGLGTIPSSVYVAFRCKTSEYGYSVGEEIRLPAFTAINSGNLEGVSISLTSTQVRVILGRSSQYLRAARANAPIGSIINLTAANWRLVVRAWA